MSGKEYNSIAYLVEIDVARLVAIADNKLSRILFNKSVLDCDFYAMRVHTISAARSGARKTASKSPSNS